MNEPIRRTVRTSNVAYFIEELKRVNASEITIRTAPALFNAGMEVYQKVGDKMLILTKRLVPQRHLVKKSINDNN
jgi:hypothetical protein